MKKAIYSLVVLALILALGFLFLWYQGNALQNKTPSYGASNPVYGVLANTNAEFAEAEQLVNAGRYDDAVPHYETALTSASDAAQAGQIEYKIAAATEHGKTRGGYMASIPLFKRIAANGQYTPITRAYAVQEIAFMPSEYGGADALAAEIFKDEPYKSMQAAGDRTLSYRHLYEYSSSLYPLANAELRIAEWYATKIYQSSQATDTAKKLDSGTIASYKDVIRQKIASADKDINRIKNLPNEEGLVAPALQREASVFANLQLSGDNSFGDAVATMKSVLNIHALSSATGRDGFARYYYAWYLAEFQGPSSNEEIRATLAPIYTDPAYTTGRLAVAPIFREERGNVRGMKPSLVALAAVDPKFKSYLESLGWSPSDFSK